MVVLSIGRPVMAAGPHCGLGVELGNWTYGGTGVGGVDKGEVREKEHDEEVHHDGDVFDILLSA